MTTFTCIKNAIFCFIIFYQDDILYFAAFCIYSTIVMKKYMLPKPTLYLEILTLNLVINKFKKQKVSRQKRPKKLSDPTHQRMNVFIDRSSFSNDLSTTCQPSQVESINITFVWIIYRLSEASFIYIGVFDGLQMTTERWTIEPAQWLKATLTTLVQSLHIDLSSYNIKNSLIVKKIYYTHYKSLVFK